MPTRDAADSMTAEAAAEWRAEGGLYVEPRLSALGVAHGFTSRALGCMKAAEARGRAASAAGLDGGILTLRQTHGAVVRPAEPEREFSDGDGWVSDRPGRGVGVFSADCPAIFLWSGDAGKLALAHSGWRGLAAGMPEAAVAALGRLGVSPGDMSAAVAPHIGPCCYEVGRELAERFAPESLSERGGKLFLNLGAETARRLAGAGVPVRRIGVSGLCTMCRLDDFFSYRAEGRALNMLAFVAVPG